MEIYYRVAEKRLIWACPVLRAVN